MDPVIYLLGDHGARDTRDGYRVVQLAPFNFPAGIVTYQVDLTSFQSQGLLSCVQSIAYSTPTNIGIVQMTFGSGQSMYLYGTSMGPTQEIDVLQPNPIRFSLTNPQGGPFVFNLQLSNRKKHT